MQSLNWLLSTFSDPTAKPVHGEPVLLVPRSSSLVRFSTEEFGQRVHSIKHCSWCPYTQPPVYLYIYHDEEVCFRVRKCFSNLKSSLTFVEGLVSDSVVPRVLPWDEEQLHFY